MGHNDLLKSCDHYALDFELVESNQSRMGKGPYFTGVDLGSNLY